MSSVSFQHIYKHYKGEQNPSVRDFHLHVEDGEFLVLVGPSGCGKSTTLRMLAGLEDISAGELYIGDRYVNYVSPKNRDIAMVFQNYALYPNLSVYENMALGLKMRKVAKYDIERRVRKAADTLEIAHLLDKKPGQLSGGQKQRVALGRAIVREPSVFLMDEPLSNLDAQLRAQTRAEISKMHQRLGTTTLYVTHDQTEAMTMGSRIVVMKSGEIQQVAPPQIIYDEPANLFVAGFIGSPKMNFIPGAVQEINGDYYFVTNRLKLSIPSDYKPHLVKAGGSLRSVILGLRPEHISFDPAALEACSHWKTRVRIEMKEPLGSDTYIYASLGDASIIARAAANTNLQAGDEPNLVFQMDKAHFFDQNSGTSLCYRGDA